MITEKAMNHMELIALQVGFSRREDYVWCRADTDKAEEFLQAELPDLISLASGNGEGVETLIRPLDSEWSHGHGAVGIRLVPMDIGMANQGFFCQCGKENTESGGHLAPFVVVVQGKRNAGVSLSTHPGVSELYVALRAQTMGSTGHSLQVKPCKCRRWHCGSPTA